MIKGKLILIFVSFNHFVVSQWLTQLSWLVVPIITDYSEYLVCLLFDPTLIRPQDDEHVVYGLDYSRSSALVCTLVNQFRRTPKIEHRTFSNYGIRMGYIILAE
jgi:hypothetical protein